MKKILFVLALLWGLPAAAQNLPPGTQGIACLASANAPTFTAGNFFAASCDLAGNLRTVGSGGGGGSSSTGTVGPAGSNGTQAQSVQGIDGGRPLPILAAQLPASLGTKAAAQSLAVSLANDQVIGTFAYAVYNATPPALANGANSLLQQSSNGSLFVDLSRSTLPAFATIPAFRIDQTTPGTTNLTANQAFDGTTWRSLLSTTTGALEPPTAASGKITVTSTALSANTNTTIAAANAARIGMGIQCGAGGVNVSETGATLASATFGATGSSINIPTNSSPPYFTPPVTTRTAVTAYTATAQTCVVTEYLR